MTRGQLARREVLNLWRQSAHKPTVVHRNDGIAAERELNHAVTRFFEDLKNEHVEVIEMCSGAAQAEPWHAVKHWVFQHEGIFL